MKDLKVSPADISITIKDPDHLVYITAVTAIDASGFKSLQVLS